MTAKAKYFDITRDIAIEKAGGIWCKACLVSRPAEEKSPDPRYCQRCYDFLLAEAALLPPTKRPRWIPKRGKEPIPVPQDMDRIMSTLKTKKIEVDIITPPSPIPKRGPRFKEIPEDFVINLAIEGVGAKSIVSRLKDEYQIEVSYKTIQRLLSGKRKQLALPTI